MKKTLSIVLVLAMILSLAGCGLFSNDAVVKLGDYTHEDPKNLKYDQRIVLKGADFGSTLAATLSSAAYPDNMVYDEEGNMIGIYDYDETTGLAKGWTNISDGSYTAFEAGKEVDLGMPDTSKLVTIPGTADLYFIVYGNESKAVSAYIYVILSDAAAKDTVISGVNTVYGFELTAVSDTVLAATLDQTAIENDFASAAEMGVEVETKDAAGYASVLKQFYGVSEYNGDVAYKPYANHQDPTDVEFDKKVVLTGSGSAAVDEKYEKNVASQTDYIYGKDGEVVADYMYLECTSKDAAEELLNSDNFYTGAKLVDDKTILVAIVGKDMEDTLTAYIGYNVLKDRSLDEYIRNNKGTYFTTEVAE